MARKAELPPVEVEPMTEEPVAPAADESIVVAQDAPPVDVAPVEELPPGMVRADPNLRSAVDWGTELGFYPMWLERPPTQQNHGGRVVTVQTRPGFNAKFPFFEGARVAKHWNGQELISKEEFLLAMKEAAEQRIG